MAGSTEFRGGRVEDSAPAGGSRLEVRDVSVTFGGVEALKDVSIALSQGEIVGLIGPNGAGKTTLLNVISGFVKPTRGGVIIRGQDVTRLSPHARARFGVARSFQAMRLFSELSVFDNLVAGALGSGIHRQEANRRAAALLGGTRLEGRADFQAGALPTGDQHLVGVLRALALRPDFLLLDEPAGGLDETESQDLVVRIQNIRREFGCGVLIIEHAMHVIMPLCERIHVLNFGRTIATGDPARVRLDPAVIEAYLGSRSQSRA